MLRVAFLFDLQWRSLRSQDFEIKMLREKLGRPTRRKKLSFAFASNSCIRRCLRTFSSAPTSFDVASRASQSLSREGVRRQWRIVRSVRRSSMIYARFFFWRENHHSCVWRQNQPALAPILDSRSHTPSPWGIIDSHINHHIAHSRFSLPHSLSTRIN